MRVIARSTLLAFVESLAGSADQRAVKAALDAWFQETRIARWTSTADIKQRYATASIVSSERIVFNVKGNDYRLIVAVDFVHAIVWSKWIGTHTDYSRIDAKEVDYDD